MFGIGAPNAAEAVIPICVMLRTMPVYSQIPLLTDIQPGRSGLFLILENPGLRNTAQTLD